MRADEVMELDVPKKEYLIKNIIPCSALVYCFGNQGSFKTNFLLWSAMNSALGNDVLEFETKKGFKTLWIDEENREDGMKEKITTLANGLGISKDILHKFIEVKISEGFNILNDESLKKLEGWIKEFKPDMIVIDSLTMVFDLDEQKVGHTKMIYRKLRPFIDKWGVTFVIIHHAVKKNWQKPNQGVEDMAGSRELAAMADSVVLFSEIGTDMFMLKHVKNRYGKKHPAINFEIVGYEGSDLLSVEYKGIISDNFKNKSIQCKEAILKWAKVTKAKNATRDSIVKIMKIEGFKTSAIDDALKMLRTEVEYNYGNYF